MTRYNGAATENLKDLASQLRQQFRNATAGLNDKVEGFTFDGQFYQRNLDGSFVDPISNKILDLDNLLRNPGAGDTPPWNTERLSDWAGRDIPERKWIMEGWIPRGQCTGLYGVSGVLKTTWLLQLLMARAGGLPFCGLPLDPGPVFGLFCEDTPDEILRRCRKIAAFYQRDLDQFHDFHFASLVGQMDTELLMFDLGKRTSGVALDHFIHDLGSVEPGLAVLDTLPDFFGGEEVNRRQTSQFIRMLDGIGMRHNCAIVTSAHPSVRGRASGRLDSGNSGIEGKMRARLTLHDPGEDDGNGDETADERAYRAALNPTDKRILTRVKSNYARPGESIELVIKDGAFSPAAIDPDEAKLRGPVRDQNCRLVFLELLDQVGREGGYINDAPNAHGRYAPKVFKAHPRNSRKFTEREFANAMVQLKADGKIKLARVGNAANGHFELVRCS